ncbi:UDP-N-acetylmuramoyl-tripeptide--D-alanyl-D-alanine ligase [candidate division KSB1 bacterium]|nr:MAG: UDP-N-acetylmuramoyl-tripeptide--D-alanyl-D-alanine ligase [candidate division KSB1 bacterium]
MPIILTLGEVLRACGEQVRFAGDKSMLRTRPAACSIDSRTCQGGDLFFALAGDKFDGHEFLPQVFEKQALAAVVSARWYEQHPKQRNNLIIVGDVLQALQNLGSAIRRRWGKPVLALTGSNGKTTTKEMVAAVLAQKKVVHKTVGNLNNHIGVPLTLSQLAFAHDMAVVEMGANHFGEIARLCEIAVPQYGLITNVGRAHLEFFGDAAGVARAKGELFHYLHEHEGIAFFNADDPYLPAVLPAGLKAVTYGLQKPAQIHGTIKQTDGGGHATLSWRNTEIRINVPGAHNAGNALAAVAIGDFFGIAPEAIRAGIEACASVSQRMQIVRKSGMVIINDAYNANPESMKIALGFLAQQPLAASARRVAILGDMLELGASAEAAHREIGEFIATLPLQAVFAYGPQTKHLVDAVGQNCWAVHFMKKQNLFAEVNRSVRPGDVLLLKGSRGMAMEEVLEKLPEV